MRITITVDMPECAGKSVELEVRNRPQELRIHPEGGLMFSREVKRLYDRMFAACETESAVKTDQ